MQRQLLRSLKLSPLWVHDPEKCHLTLHMTQASDLWGARMARATATAKPSPRRAGASIGHPSSQGRHSSSSAEMRAVTQILSGSWCKLSFLMRADICITFHMWRTTLFTYSLTYNVSRHPGLLQLTGQACFHPSGPRCLTQYHSITQTFISSNTARQ